MTGRNAHFFDLDTLRQVASQIAEGGEVRAGGEGEGYLKFTAEAPLAKRSPAASTSALPSVSAAPTPPAFPVPTAAPPTFMPSPERSEPTSEEVGSLPPPVHLRATLRAPEELVSLPPQPAASVFGESGWDAMLAKVLRAAPATGAFVVSSEGLTVASAGGIENVESESAGARLLVALEQAARIGGAQGEADSVIVPFREGWLSGIRRRSEPEFTLGVFAPLPVDNEAITRILRVFLV